MIPDPIKSAAFARREVSGESGQAQSRQSGGGTRVERRRERLDICAYLNPDAHDCVGPRTVLNEPDRVASTERRFEHHLTEARLTVIKQYLGVPKDCLGNALRAVLDTRLAEANARMRARRTRTRQEQPRKSGDTHR
jgi:hypothetical protein